MNENCQGYPNFEPNQALTADHLNDLAAYLEVQDRWTRQYLIGSGIVCGLDVSTSGSPPQITITMGCGITSEGYLIELLPKGWPSSQISNTWVYTKYKKYEDPAKYSLFSNIQGDLLELLPEESTSGDKLDSTILNEKVVLLYLEHQTLNNNTCTGDNCDNKGKWIQFCVKVLLIKKSDLDSLIQSAYGYSSGTDLEKKWNGWYDLPDIRIMRIDAKQALSDVTSYDHLVTFYTDLIDDVVINQKLKTALENTYNLYEPFFKSMYPSNPFTGLDLSKLTAEKTGIQYGYDHLKDLILAYQEFKDTAFDLCMDCCLNPNLFPKHLMLGEPDPKGCEPSVYRQKFIYAPILDGQNRRREQVILLFKRMVLLSQSFSIPASSEIKITPSKEKGTLLSSRSIPYYYKQDSILNLKEVWDFELVRRCRKDLILSYYDSADHLVDNIDDYGFFRIEGHLGQSYPIALKTLQSIIDKKSLPIEVLALELAMLQSTTASGGSTGQGAPYYFDIMKVLDLSKWNFATLANQPSTAGNAMINTVFDTLFKSGTGIKGSSYTGKKKISDLYDKQPVVSMDPSLSAAGSFPSTAVPDTSDETSSSDAGDSDCRFQDLDLTYQMVRTELLCMLEKASTVLASQGVQGQSTQTDSKTGIKGIVQDESGAPLPGATVVLEGTTMAATTDVNGNFQIVNVVPGSYKVRANFGASQTTNQSVTVTKDQITNVTLQFQSSSGSAGTGSFNSGVIGTGTGYLSGTLISNVLNTVNYTGTVGGVFNNYLLSPSANMMAYFTNYGLMEPGIFTVLYYPAAILDLINKVDKALPVELQLFQWNTFNSQYMSLIDTCKAYLKVILDNLNSKAYQKTGNEQLIVDALNWIIQSCTYEKLKALTEWVQKRMQLIEDMTVFAYYIQKHPGMEHQAGVVKGGTFLLVYDDKNTVVADFSLPYICCSDCPPMILCFPEKVQFKLSQSLFYKQDKTKYPFTLDPAGGTVEGEGVVEETGNFSFQPSSSEVKEGPVTFKYFLNGETYQLSVQVVNFSASFIYQKKDPVRDTINVEFTGPSGMDEYLWTFEKGKTSAKQNPTYQYKLTSKIQDKKVNLLVKKDRVESTSSSTISLPAASSVDKVVDFSLSKMLNAEKKDLFKSVIGEEDDRYKEAVKEMKALKQDLKNDEDRRPYIDGEKNKTIADKFRSSLKDAYDRITGLSARQAKQRTFIYEYMYLPRITVFLELINCQKADLNPDDPLVSVMDEVNTQLMTLKSKGVNINLQQQLEQLVTKSLVSSSNKSVYSKKLKILQKENL